MYEVNHRPSTSIISKTQQFTLPHVFLMDSIHSAESLWNPCGIHGIHKDFCIHSPLIPHGVSWSFHGVSWIPCGFHMGWMYPWEGELMISWGFHGFHMDSTSIGACILSWTFTTVHSGRDATTSSGQGKGFVYCIWNSTTFLCIVNYSSSLISLSSLSSSFPLSFLNAASEWHIWYDMTAWYGGTNWKFSDVMHFIVASNPPNHAFNC